MKQIKRIIIITLAALFLINTSAPIFASEEKEEGRFNYGENSYTHNFSDTAGNTVISWGYYDDQYASLLSEMRDAMKERKNTITVTYHMSNAINDAEEYGIVLDLLYDACIHTGDPKGGDCIYQNISSVDMESYTSSGTNNKNDMTITYKIDWRSTEQQEEETSNEIDRILNSFNWTKETSDYEKIADIYGYLTSTVTYSWEDYNSEQTTGNDCHAARTAYGALINHTAICEGIAVAFYQMALKAGINCRCIEGISNGESHVWNIVELDGEYYNIDATRDLGNTSYGYFLKSDASFGESHTRSMAYNNTFYSMYPMADTDYVNHAAERQATDNNKDIQKINTEDDSNEQTAYTGFMENEDGKWYIENNEITFKKNGVIQDETGAIGKKGTWYYVIGSKVQDDFTGLSDYQNENGWWYITNGAVDFTYNGIAVNRNGYYYIFGGKTQTGFSGIVKDNGWWYIKNGKADTGTLRGSIPGLWFEEDGKTSFWMAGFTNYMNAQGLWHIKNGKAKFVIF